MPHLTDYFDVATISKWSFIDYPGLQNLIKNEELFFALLLLSDCPACHKALSSIDVPIMESLGVKSYAVIFQEMNKESMNNLSQLRVAIAPEGRLYSNGIVVSAWQSVSLEATSEDINNFVLGWLADAMEKLQSLETMKL